MFYPVHDDLRTYHALPVVLILQCIKICIQVMVVWQQLCIGFD